MPYTLAHNHYLNLFHTIVKKVDFYFKKNNGLGHFFHSKRQLRYKNPSETNFIETIICWSKTILPLLNCIILLRVVYKYSNVTRVICSADEGSILLYYCLNSGISQEINRDNKQVSLLASKQYKMIIKIINWKIGQSFRFIRTKRIKNSFSLHQALFFVWFTFCLFVRIYSMWIN